MRVWRAPSRGGFGNPHVTRRVRRHSGPWWSQEGRPAVRPCRWGASPERGIFFGFPKPGGLDLAWEVAEGAALKPF